MRILRTMQETFADGPGIRYAIYVAGCDLQCEDCHNPQSWAFNQGEVLSLLTLSRIKNDIKSNPMLTGITISGGDPLHPDNASGTLLLLEELEELGKHVMLYTGHTADELINGQNTLIQKLCLRHVDVLVDGPFIKNQRDTTTFRGSTNQRFIKTKEMHKNGHLRADKIEDYVVTHM
jgi:anaerobic ribonucleoside-triphosphate reductase activating protein